MRQALIRGTLIENIVNSSGGNWSPPEGLVAVDDPNNEAQIGGTYSGGVFSPAPTPPLDEGPWFFSLAADQSTSSNALIDVPGWSLQLRPNTKYRFDLNLWFRTAATTTGILFSVTGPASPIALDIALETQLTASTMNIQRITVYDGGTPTASIDTVSADRLARMRGFIQTGATGGVLKLRARSEVNNSQVTLKAGSTGQIWTV